MHRSGSLALAKILYLFADWPDRILYFPVFTKQNTDDFYYDGLQKTQKCSVKSEGAFLYKQCSHGLGQEKYVAPGTSLIRIW